MPLNRTGEMETRGKNKNAGATAETAPDVHDARAKELTTKEFELEEIARSMRDKEARLRSQENKLQQRLQEIDLAQKNLTREREAFTRNAGARETELTERERNLIIKTGTASGFETHNTDRHNSTEYEREERSPQMYRRGPYWGDETPRVSFREATEAVPKFDGYNIPLQQFTRACRRAREIIPPSAEGNLTKLLINRLSGRAYYAVEDEPCSTVLELIDLLTGAFGSSKTLDQYRGELSTIYMKPREHIIDYISRVKDLRTAILDAERRERGSVDAYFVNEIDGLTARSFFQGLPLEYRLQIKEESRHRYTDAFAAAKRISKEQEIDRRRSEHNTNYNRDRNSNPVRNQPLNNPPRVSDNTGYRNTQYPNDKPQYRDNKFTKNTSYRDTRYPKEEPPVNKVESRSSLSQTAQTFVPRTFGDNQAIKSCRYCKAVGHEISECRKRQYFNSLNKNNQANQGNENGPAGQRDNPSGSNERQMRPLISEKTRENNHEPESQQ